MPHMKNPFRYGMRVGGREFFDRTKVIRDIRNTLDGGNKSRRDRPRRFRKNVPIRHWRLSIRAHLSYNAKSRTTPAQTIFIASYYTELFRLPSTGLRPQHKTRMQRGLAQRHLKHFLISCQNRVSHFWHEIRFFPISCQTAVAISSPICDNIRKKAEYVFRARKRT